MSTYLITGATRGIGRAVADELADDDLILAARDGEALDSVCKSLRSARPMRADLAQPEALAGAVGGAGLPDRLDGIVHSAGINHLGRLADLEPAAWTELFAVNVTAIAELTRLALPALRKACGTVVFVNSGSGRRVAGPGSGAYSASKFALVAVAEALRMEEPEVRVTTVFPGRVATDMQRQLRAFERGDYRPDDYLRPETVAKIIVDALRLPGDATVADAMVVPRQ
jgi:NAD(P)-dependent dehydrogenase (short-subunit alcohol dehydrogenase family)